MYTDGACSGNPGPGGWAAILIYNGKEKELSGNSPNTTNNRMELMAPIMALKQLKEPCEVTIYTDSAYVHNAFKEGWLEAWQNNGWRTSTKKEVANQDLWKLLISATHTHNVKWVKVKGHSDNIYNNRCDKLAVDEIKKIED
ncbi:MAG: ribonuclease HI [Clostridia bacterium]|nr:ribonuclease HI [Clostridia bacterium]